MNANRNNSKTKSPKKTAKPAPSKQAFDYDTLRFEVTVHRGRTKKGIDWISGVEIDRVPDAKGRVRGLATLKACIAMLEKGLEVRLYRVHFSDSLDPKLIEDDESFERWLDAELSKIKSYTDRKNSKNFKEA